MGSDGQGDVMTSVIHRPGWGLSAAELVTTLVAIVVSSTLYLTHGHNYLARGIVGDLCGFVVLAAITVTGRRARHEALACLVGIGILLLLAPDWPLRLSWAAWWGVFAAGLGLYLLARLRVAPVGR